MEQKPNSRNEFGILKSIGAEPGLHLVAKNSRDRSCEIAVRSKTEFVLGEG
jgi:hypothetical protein